MKLTPAFILLAVATAAVANSAAPQQDTTEIAITGDEAQVIAFAIRRVASECGAGNEALCQVGTFEKQIDAKLSVALRSLPPQQREGSLSERESEHGWKK